MVNNNAVSEETSSLLSSMQPCPQTARVHNHHTHSPHSGFTYCLGSNDIYNNKL